VATYTTPDAVDLSTYLGAAVSDDRATMLLRLAEQLCLSVVAPLPAGAEAVVMDVAARAYSNPQNLTEQATGPYVAAYGAVGGGLWLTAKNERTLRRLTGSGQAFTINPTPADAGPANAWAQVPEIPSEAFTNPPFYGDFDQTP
jgi:hypothetical protein